MDLYEFIAVLMRVAFPVSLVYVNVIIFVEEYSYDHDLNVH
jgi:hypothetical protein